MRRCVFSGATVAACLTAALGATWFDTVHAQAPSDWAWRSLYAQVIAILNTGPATPANSSTSFVMLPRGIVLDPFVDEADPHDEELLSRLLDRAPKAQWLFDDNGTTASSVYQAVLQHGEPVPVPVTPGSEEAATAARRFLFVDGDAAKGHTAIHERYLSLKQEFESAVSQAAAQPDSQVLRNRVQTARQRFETLGRKNQVEAALTRLDNANRRDLFDLARKKLTASASATNGRLLTRTVPPASAWLDDGGWTQLSFTLQPDQNAGPLSPAPPAVWRRTGPSGAAPSLPQRLTIALEMKRVRLDRDWIEPAVFLSKWRWTANAPQDARVPISRTGSGGAISGALPCLPTQGLLVRNLRLRGNWSRTELRALWRSARTATELGFGPFSLTGRYAAAPGETAAPYVARPDAQGLFSSEVQLIGLICESLPPQP